MGFGPARFPIWFLAIRVCQFRYFCILFFFAALSAAVQKVGFEPTRCKHHTGLSRTRMPFRHFCICSIWGSNPRPPDYQKQEVFEQKQAARKEIEEQYDLSPLRAMCARDAFTFDKGLENIQSGPAMEK